MTEEPLTPAATIVLLRDNPLLEVLMIERHANMGFAGGAVVFPGGRVDDSDSDPAWSDHAIGLPENPRHATAAIAAIRETFEEVGMLIASYDGEPACPALVEQLQPLRSVVEKDASRFLTLIRVHGLKLAADRLTLFAHWVAPPAMHKRFDTIFFAAPAPLGQEPREDGNEATESIWIAPKDVIAACQAGTRKIIFPTLRNIELLAEQPSAAAVIENAKARRIAPIQPWQERDEDGVVLRIPDDMGYPITRERLDSLFRG